MSKKKHRQTNTDKHWRQTQAQERRKQTDRQSPLQSFYIFSSFSTNNTHTAAATVSSTTTAAAAAEAATMTVKKIIRCCPSHTVSVSSSLVLFLSVSLHFISKRERMRVAEKERTSRRAGLGIGKRVGEMLLIFIILSLLLLLSRRREKEAAEGI